MNKQHKSTSAFISFFGLKTQPSSSVSWAWQFRSVSVSRWSSFTCKKSWDSPSPINGSTWTNLAFPAKSPSSPHHGCSGMVVEMTSKVPGECIRSNRSSGKSGNTSAPAQFHPSALAELQLGYTLLFWKGQQIYIYILFIYIYLNTYI